MSSVIGVTCSLEIACRMRILPTTGPFPCVMMSSFSRLQEGQQRAARRRGDGGLLLGGAAYLGRMGRVAAHGDEEAFGKFGRGGHLRYLPINPGLRKAAAYKCGYKSRAVLKAGRNILQQAGDFGVGKNFVWGVGEA